MAEKNLDDRDKNLNLFLRIWQNSSHAHKHVLKKNIEKRWINAPFYSVLFKNKRQIVAQLEKETCLGFFLL